MNAHLVTTALRNGDDTAAAVSPGPSPEWKRRPTSDAEHVALRIIATIVVLALVAGAIFLCWLWYLLANMTIVF